MMRVRFTFSYIPGMQGKQAYKDVTVYYEYTMNEELKEEYWPQYKDTVKETILLTKVSDKEFTAQREFPHGAIRKCEFKEHDKVIKDDPEQCVQTIVDVYPKVKSEADLRKDKDMHEVELQNLEQQMKAKHLKDKENKRKQEEEKEKAKIAFSKITNKLGKVWEVIDRTLVPSEDEASECVYLLSTHYEKLYPVFAAYSRQVPQFVQSHENDYILLQHFFHFVKEYAFGCNNMEDYYSLLGSLSPLIENKVVDSLNLYNGLNFAGFIEGIIRIACIRAKIQASEADKLEESKDPDEPPKPIKIAAALEELLANFDIAFDENMSKPAKHEMLIESTGQMFGAYFYTLGVVFKENAAVVDQTEFEMKREDFISMLSELKLLDKEPLNDKYVNNLIDDFSRIKHDNLLFPEILEILYAVVMIHSSVEATPGTSKHSKKLMEVLDKLQVDNQSDTDKFKLEIESARKTKGYEVHYLLPDIENPGVVGDYQDGNEEANLKNEEEADEVDELKE